ncbi:MAG TPA: PilZ domain-containing protein, partial [Polyangiaceae bacterium]|nr:PilZ domain-containing protein [Polyangiaceae bacterium]
MTRADEQGREPETDVERRDSTAPRMNYEALVEVGSRSVGGFEAESVDVSLDGIRLRTAYLPTPGERLVCRFDGFGGEIVAEGQVAWCHDEGRGGEFGVRFTRLDARALELLKHMCHDEQAPAAEPSAPAAGQVDAAQPGARVRLHIQGLGSPMRARVRDVARGEVLIGSNLEFLRVGRDVELEDVDRGSTRVAHIEHVSVDIDPDTSIPQLVVALVYGGDMEADDLTTAPLKVRPAERETTPEPTVIDSEPKRESARVKREVRRVEAPKPNAKPEPTPAEAQPEDDDYEEDEDVRPAMANAAAAKVGAVARKVGPAIAKVGVGAGVAIGRLIGAVKRRREEKRDARERQRAPKRTTAPPPSGALRSNGKKLFRETQRNSDPPAEVEEAPPPKHDRKRTVFGIVLGLMAVVAIYFASSHFSRAQEGGTQAVASAPSEQPSAAPTGEADMPGEPTGAVATANVPLFGATPLSTTEPVPVPTNIDGKAPPPGQAAKGEGEAGDEGAAAKKS